MAHSRQHEGKADASGASDAIKSLANAFALAWRSGDRPKIEDYLLDDQPTRLRLLKVILAVELEHRRRLGEEPSVAEYTQRFPSFADTIRDMLESASLEETVSILSQQDAGVLASTLASPSVDTTAHLTQTISPPGKLDDYELLEEVAHGGMGVVYKARQTRLNRIVALKMIRSGELATEEEIKRFQAEAEAAAQLDHLNIVPIYEVGELQGQHFFSMAYVEGRSLQQELQLGPLTPKDAAAMAQKIANAIDYAHAKGIVHRDLKPANILMDDNQPKVTDFGLAKHVSAKSGMTATGQVMGTPSYMPPEQARGDASQIGPKSDVYSLGAILYAAITGRPPFQAANIVETLKQVVEREPVAPRQLNPTVDKDLETICLKCLHKVQEKRYATAAQLGEDLERYLEGRPIIARPIGLAERSWRWVRRNPLAATSVAILVTSFFVSSYFGAMARQSAEDYRQESGRNLKLANENDAAATKNKLLAEANAATAKKNETLANDNLVLANKYRDTAARERIARDEKDAQRYATTMTLAFNRYQQGDLESVNELLRNVIPNEDDTDYRGFEWHHLWRLAHKEVRRFPSQGPGIYAIAISPDDRFVVTGSDNGTLTKWDVQTSAVVASVGIQKGPIRTICFDPNGGITVAGDDGKIRMMSSALDGEAEILGEHTEAIRDLDFSSDGKLLATTSAGEGALGQVKIWNVGDKTEPRIVDAHQPADLTAAGLSSPWGASSVAFSPDGSLLATTGYESSVKIWDTKSMEKVHEFSIEPKSWMMSAAFSPNGKMLAAVGMDGICRVWDVEDEALHASFEAAGWLPSCEFSPDGRQLAAGGSLHHFDSGKTTRVAPGNVHVFSSDGMNLYTAGFDGEMRQFRATDNSSVTEIESPSPGGVRFVQFGQHGERLFASTRLGKVIVWNKSSFLDPSEINVDQNHAFRWRVNPGGRLMVTTSRNAMKVWDTQKGKALQSFPGSTRLPVFSADGQFFAHLLNEKSIPVWDFSQAKVMHHLKDVECQPIFLALSKREDQIVIVGADNTIRQVDYTTGETQSVITSKIDEVGSPAYNVEQHILATLGRNGITIWDLDSQTALRSFGDPSVSFLDASPRTSSTTSIRFDRTGNTVVFWRGPQARLFQTATGQEITSLRSELQHEWADVSPDGSLALAGVHPTQPNGPGLIKVYHVASKEDIDSWHVENQKRQKLENTRAAILRRIREIGTHTQSEGGVDAHALWLHVPPLIRSYLEQCPKSFRQRRQFFSDLGTTINTLSSNRELHIEARRFVVNLASEQLTGGLDDIQFRKFEFDWALDNLARAIDDETLPTDERRARLEEAVKIWPEQLENNKQIVHHYRSFLSGRPYREELRFLMGATKNQLDRLALLGDHDNVFRTADECARLAEDCWVSQLYVGHQLQFATRPDSPPEVASRYRSRIAQYLLVALEQAHRQNDAATAVKQIKSSWPFQKNRQTTEFAELVKELAANEQQDD